ncbi:MAG TPA: alanine racemase [Terracidiphilus sp.]|nr:alanine racemase [Terracidiphilus sp.]
MPTRPCWVGIRTRALEDNFRFLASTVAPHAELLAIVKADAYGHGLVHCVPTVVRAGVRWLGVTSVEEGIAARALCAEPRILVIGGIFPGQGADVLRHNLTAVVWEPYQLDELEAAASGTGLAPASLSVHLEFDTGMSRQGVDAAGLGTILARFTPQSPLRLDGLMTHLFASDEADGRATQEQLIRLEQAIAQVHAAGHRPEWLNVGATAALLAGDAEIVSTLAARHGMSPLLRPGLALYGVVPRYVPPFAEEPAVLAAARKHLRPVLSWKSRVVSVRAAEPGTAVGYNGTFVATEPMRLALIAAGYADGLDRMLGNRFSLLVRGQRAPLAGRISMDQAVLDVTEIDDVAPGDEVVILGTQGEETITAFDHADACGTIPWEVFTRIGQRVERRAI